MSSQSEQAIFEGTQKWVDVGGEHYEQLAFDVAIKQLVESPAVEKVTRHASLEIEPYNADMSDFFVNRFSHESLESRMARDYLGRVSIMEQATFDPLTGVLNRAAFGELAKRYIESQSLTEGERKKDTDQKGGVAILYFDLDGFKAINDTQGHAAGDSALVQFADMLKETVRVRDLVARLGGDEFVALLNDNIDEEAAKAVAERIIQGTQNIMIGETNSGLHVSVGVSLWVNGATYQQMLEQADARMFRAKQAGTDLIVCSD